MPLIVKKKKKKTNRTSRQTQAGIGHSTPAHRGAGVLCPVHDSTLGKATPAGLHGDGAVRPETLCNYPWECGNGSHWLQLAQTQSVLCLTANNALFHTGLMDYCFDA